MALGNVSVPKERLLPRLGRYAKETAKQPAFWGGMVGGLATDVAGGYVATRLALHRQEKLRERKNKKMTMKSIMNSNLYKRTYDSVLKRKGEQVFSGMKDFIVSRKGREMREKSRLKDVYRKLLARNKGSGRKALPPPSGVHGFKGKKGYRGSYGQPGKATRSSRITMAMKEYYRRHPKRVTAVGAGVGVARAGAVAAHKKYRKALGINDLRKYMGMANMTSHALACELRKKGAGDIEREANSLQPVKITQTTWHYRAGKAIKQALKKHPVATMAAGAAGAYGAYKGAKALKQRKQKMGAAKSAKPF